jgi:hypothetical protein
LGLAQSGFQALRDFREALIGRRGLRCRGLRQHARRLTIFATGFGAGLGRLRLHGRRRMPALGNRVYRRSAGE